MFNYCVLIFLTVIFGLSILTVLAEFAAERNSACGRFFRAIRIRLRELSMVRVWVTSILLLLFGLAVGDDMFLGIWSAIALLFGTLAVLHPEEFLDLYKKRKKAKLRKDFLPLTPVLAENLGVPLRELPETPVLPEMKAIECEAENASDNVEEG